MIRVRTSIGLVTAFCLPVLAMPSTTEQLQTAVSNDNVAFVLVTEPAAAGTDRARQTIQSAMTQVPGSVMIESNRTDASNAEFIQKYGLATVALPLILVFGSNGAIAGGNIASRLNPQQLVAMVPSPKKAEVLQALQSGKAVYITASRPGMASKSEVVSGCAAACQQMMGRGTTVEVNMDSPAETKFLQQLKVDMHSTEPVTVVINSRGQVAGSYTGTVEVDSLIASAAKVVTSSCCPSGSGKSCGPTKKSGGK